MREEYVVKNQAARIVNTFLVAILGLVSKKIFVNCLGDTIMGLNALLLSILSMLSLLELGIGNAIYFSLYKPLAENDTLQVNAIMRLYAKIYKVIGSLVFLIGLALIPFLHFFVNIETTDTMLYHAYFILLADTSLSYYMAYRRNIFDADQKQYFNMNVSSLIDTAVVCIQMAVVVLTRNYYMFLFIRMVGTVAGNLYIYIQSGLKYPYLKEKVSYQLSKEFINTFKENIKALCMIKISEYLVFGTDNLLLSRYTNLTEVFIYSNYIVILNTVNRIFHTLFASMQAGIGNFMVLEGEEKTYKLFQKVFFLNFLVTSYTSTALLTLFNDAITFWMGREYIWSLGIVIILVFNNYSRHILEASGVFRNAAGLYNPFPAYKYLTLLEGIINLAASLFFILVCKIGTFGVFLGTSVSSIISTVITPYVVYKYYFKRSVARYIQRYVQYFILTIIYCVLSVSLYRLVCTNYIILNLAIGIIISFLLPIGLSGLIYHRTEEFQFVRETVEKYWNKLKKKH